MVLCNETAALLREAVDEVRSVAVAQAEPIQLTRADADTAYEGLMYVPSRSPPSLALVVSVEEDEIHTGNLVRAVSRPAEALRPIPPEGTTHT